MDDLNPSILIMSEYVNARTHVSCLCKKCGHQWMAKPSNLKTGYGCPVCAIQSIKDAQRKVVDEFVDELAAINPDIEYLGGYTNNKGNVRLGCRVCGHEWYAMPINILRHDGKNTGCPHCRSSHGEKYIRDWLTERNIRFESQVRFDGLVGVKGKQLSYDFYVPSLNTLIEYQGEYHDHTARLQTQQDYDMQVEHDRRKAEYAQDHGFILYPIWYYDNKEEKLNYLLHNITDPVTTTAS